MLFFCTRLGYFFAVRCGYRLVGCSDFDFFFANVNMASEKIWANNLNRAYERFQPFGLIFTSPKMTLKLKNFDIFFTKTPMKN